MQPVQEDAATQPAGRVWAWLPVILLLVNAGLTAWVVFSLHPMETAIFSDMKEYVFRADQVADGLYDLNHFFQPIGYSLWIVLWRYLDAGGWELLKLTHVLLVVLSVYFGWQTARMLLPRKWDVIVLLLLSANIQWIQLASYALSETLFTFFLTTLLWATVRWVRHGLLRDAVLTGFLFGLGFFVKGSAVFFPPLLLLWSILCVLKHRQRLQPVINQLLVMGGCALLIALLHGTYSQVTYGQFKLGADAGGLNFVEGKCPAKHNFDNTGYSWLSPLHYYLGETEEKHWDVPFSDQGYYWAQGWECVKQDPFVIVTSLRYVYYLFAGNPLWPHAEEGKYYELWFKLVIVPLFLVGLFVACRCWDQPIFIPALLLVSLFLVAWIFKSELRFRVPFDAAVMLYAVLGAKVLVSGLLKLTGWQVGKRAAVTADADGNRQTL